jgi:hypothetical protein
VLERFMEHPVKSCHLETKLSLLRMRNINWKPQLTGYATDNNQIYQV